MVGILSPDGRGRFWWAVPSAEVITSSLETFALGKGWIAPSGRGEVGPLRGRTGRRAVPSEGGIECCRDYRLSGE